MLSTKVQELLRIRNIMKDKDKFITGKDMAVLSSLINLPETGSYHDVIYACDIELDRIRLCLL